MIPLLIISPMFPPMPGGLPDHTARLAGMLSADFEVTVLTSPGVDVSQPYAVSATATNWRNPAALVAAIEKASPTGPVLWQYVPHMYGRGGVNLALPRVIGRLRMRGRRQVVLVHEIAAPFSWWPHRTWYALAQRWMWRGVCERADALGISTGGWLERLQGSEARPDRLFLSPSPCNLPVAAVEPGHARAWLERRGLGQARRVLGFFGSPGAGKQFDWLLAAWRESRKDESLTALVAIGDKPNAAVGSEERPLYRAEGYLDQRSASEALQALDLLLLPFSDGVSERRSSFMAGLAHGLPVLTTIGTATSTELRRADFFRCTAPLLSDFVKTAASLAGDIDALRELGRRSRAQYLSFYDWPRLAETLKARLGGARSTGGE